MQDQHIIAKIQKDLLKLDNSLPEVKDLLIQYLLQRQSKILQKDDDIYAKSLLRPRRET